MLYLLPLATFSQSVESKEEIKDGKIHIKVNRSENGNKMVLDTIISKEQLPELKKELAEKGINLDVENSPTAEWNKTIIKKRHGNKLSEDYLSELSVEIDKEIKIVLENLGEELDMLGEKLKELNFDLHYDLKDENGQMKIQMFIPKAPESPGMQISDELPDSLKRKEFVTIIAEKDEKLPTIEKEIITGNGKRVIVIKRNLAEQNKLKIFEGELNLSKVNIYPNPGDGILSIRFFVRLPVQISIRITDLKGNEIYIKDIQNFSGEYFDRVEVPDATAGTYLIKITAGDEIISKKIFVE